MFQCFPRQNGDVLRSRCKEKILNLRDHGVNSVVKTISNVFTRVWISTIFMENVYPTHVTYVI